MSVKITYFVHGTTTDNEKDLATGWAPGELSDVGIEQSQNLGDLVAHIHFDTIFTSDLSRAVESAALAFGNKYEIIQDERLREANYGEYTQKEVRVFKSDMTKYINTPFPNGESYKDVENRLKSFCYMLKEQYENKHVAIVAHQAPQLALEVILNNKNWEQAISEDWRKIGAWKPGWDFTIK